MAHAQGLLPPGDQGQHYATLASRMPQALLKAASHHRAALRQLNPELPGWYISATQAQKDTLKTFIDASWNSLNQWEAQMAKVQTVTAFAQPLLEAALNEAGYTLDVQHTYLLLYVPAEDAFGQRTGGFIPKKLSLLHAALNNFEAP